MKRMLAGLYRGWMAFAYALGRVQTFLILSVIYFLVLGIIAPLVRLLSGDPLDRRMGVSGSVWTPKPKSNLSLREARHLF